MVKKCVDASYAASIFYTLEALYTIVGNNMQFGMKSHERLYNDIIEYRNDFIPKLADALYDYTVMVVFGEMRHSKYHASHYIENIPTSDMGRADAFELAKDYDPSNILETATILFDPARVRWDYLYGGYKWFLIAQHGLRRGRISDVIFCDTCFSLSHNQNPYLDKAQTNIFKIFNPEKYKNFLDYKFKHEPNDVIVCFSNYVGYRLKKLIFRAINLGFLPNFSVGFSDESADWVEYFIFNYTPIKWGEKIISPKLYETYNYIEDDDSYEEDYYESEEEEKEEYVSEEYNTENNLAAVS